MKKLIILTIAIIAVISFSNCTKELDFSSPEYYDVSEFLKSKNCQTKCGIKAPCEGEKVKLQGFIDEMNMMRESSTFYLNDLAREKYNIEIKVDSLINDAIFDLIQNQISSNFRIEGLVEGFDKPTNFKCERGYFLHLINESDLIVY